MDAVAGYDSLWGLRYRTYSARGLYAHIPFCANKCAYCDFASWATNQHDDLMRQYVIALQHEIEHVGWIGLLDECHLGFVGGGTPTFLGDPLWWLCQTINAMIEIQELTCEANPESTSTDLLGHLKENGVTRISMGVQSLCDKELKALGRIHSAKTALGRMDAIKGMGFDLSCDVMLGIPYQTKESLRDTLRQICEHSADHMSCYPLQIEPHTYFDAAVKSGLIQDPDPDFQAELMEFAQAFLAKKGYARYEVASYAKPHKQCAFNKLYWTGQPYLGLGTNACSMLSAAGYKKLQEAAKQLPDLDQDIQRVRLRCLSTKEAIAQSSCIDQLSFEIECLDITQALAEDLMLGARMVQGIDPDLVTLAEHQLGAAKVDSTLEDLLDQGLLETTSTGYLAPTQKGWLLGNELFGELWALAEGEISVLTC